MFAYIFLGAYNQDRLVIDSGTNNWISPWAHESAAQGHLARIISWLLSVGSRLHSDYCLPRISRYRILWGVRSLASWSRIEVGFGSRPARGHLRILLEDVAWNLLLCSSECLGLIFVIAHVPTPIIPRIYEVIELNQTDYL